MKQMSSDSLCLSPHPVRLPLPSKFFSSPTRVSARTGDSPTFTNDSRSLNLSVLRFTLGIPGLDESFLPRWVGYGFGSLLLLNQFVGSDPSSLTPAQLRTEALGLSVAAFSVVLPYLGKFQPTLFQDLDYDMQMAWKNKGFLILASSIEYTSNDKDSAWIQAVANKFRASIIWVCQSSCKVDSCKDNESLLKIGQALRDNAKLKSKEPKTGLR